METENDLPPGIGTYEDFHTIDWLRDIARDRMRHRQIQKRKEEGCLQEVYSAHDAWSGWICVLFVGCLAGQSYSSSTQFAPKEIMIFTCYCFNTLAMYTPGRKYGKFV